MQHRCRLRGFGARPMAAPERYKAVRLSPTAREKRCKEPTKWSFALRNQPLSCQFLTRRQAAQILGVSLEWLKSRLADGDLPHYKFGRSVRIHSDDLADFVTACRRPHTGASS